MSEFKQKSNGSSSRTIYINPHFKKPITYPQQVISARAHINPLFLGAHRPPAIHMNPNFVNNTLLNRQSLPQNNDVRNLTSESVIRSSVVPPQHMRIETIDLCRTSDHLLKESNINKNLKEYPDNKITFQKIISKSRTKIVREPALVNDAPTPTSDPLIRLSSKKLVRRMHVRPTTSITQKTTLATSISTIGKYKLVRSRGGPCITTKSKALTPSLKFKRKTFVARYALQRSTSESKITPTSSKLRALPVNKKLQLLNINGVLYRSTRNKLQRKDTTVPPNKLASAGLSTLSLKSNSNATQKSNKNSYGRVIFVHGTKFELDKTGFKLTRLTPTSIQSVSGGLQNSEGTASRLRQRIDIGGLTYVASTTQNVFVRTRNHLTLAHLNTAKNRSLQLLTRRLVKSNIPCAIFQRIGKCIAHERGRCNKVHDKRQVTICPRFLRSECHNSECLLSHNVSLAKMPVCKFFLQGVCVRTDCPYLHKKLSVNADICPDFLRGYCKLADQCNKRHEFVCPEYERSGNCEMASCVYCKNRKRKRLNEQPSQHNKAGVTARIKESPGPGSHDTSAVPLRYFTDKDTHIAPSEAPEVHKADEKKDPDTHSEIDDMPPVSFRPKVGALPAFIPLS
ncbi:PREDICTED: zinc finger CCCH domain-containing protein 3 [Rhagoletis zephyria]|uniref:zinc finger CCCH domain-containing protein 3 n=1 Tax=Rhagoletis zephyria TaxID=28612 RepID=UPI0008114626|nr:PREDICTED: zinc finger CCCH domain-containing protein 3 [Rhagoletis zephyria]